jgi:prevent-host-death family protein
MKTISAPQANQEFSAILARAERGEEILITKHNKPRCGLESLSAIGDDRRAQKGNPARRASDEHGVALGRRATKVYAR